MEGEMRGRIWILAATALVLQVVLAPPAGAARGVLDPTFGGDGKVTTDFDTGVDVADDLVIQADGKIVAAGQAEIGDQGVFGLVRYDQDGSLDPTFGSDGRVTTPFFGSEALALAVQGDGKIVAVGATGTDSTGGDFALARYEPDGTLDPSFGDEGTVTTDFHHGNQLALDVALQGNGKIVVAGETSGPGGFHRDFAVARYEPDGTLDASFGTGGMVRTDFGYFDRANAVAIQGNGRIVVAGEVTGPVRGDIDFGLARYNLDGTLDRSFGTGGRVRTSFGGEIDRAEDLVVQGNGKIVVAGLTTAGVGGDFALARYAPDGALDPGFGAGGMVTTDFGGQGDDANALVLQGNGKIVAAGLAGTGSQEFGLAQYNLDGSLNVRFGRGGKVVTDFVGNPDDATAVALTADGKIVVAGEAFIGRTGLFDFDIDFALARYS
jgi:uncharacterized delta-60 repeat protein